ncbi:hypothetical protein, partial [Aeromonas veronii]|uniref:hypothetical protein n=1 Tax=Aeromonas veronii TaxID=654 RepID=UPI003D20C718
GVAGSSPVRSATNLKAFPNGKAFLLCTVFPVTSRFALQNEHQGLVSRPGFGAFSVLNHQSLAFPCQVRVPDSRLFPPFSGYILALQVSFAPIWAPLQVVKSGFCRLLATEQFHIDHPLFHLHVDLEAKPFG